MNEEEIWLNTTDECPALGDSLPDPTVDPDDPPISQWDDLRDNFVTALKAWLGTADRIPGMPTDVPDVSMLDPDDQWEMLKNFEDDVSDFSLFVVVNVYILDVFSCMTLGTGTLVNRTVSAVQFRRATAMTNVSSNGTTSFRRVKMRSRNMTRSLALGVMPPRCIRVIGGKGDCY